MGVAGAARVAPLLRLLARGAPADAARASIRSVRCVAQSTCMPSTGAPVFRTPVRPAFARASARSFHLCPLCPFTCLSHSFPRVAHLACFHSSRATAASALFFRALHTLVVIMAAYLLSYLIKAGVSAPRVRTYRRASIIALSSAVLFESTSTSSFRARRGAHSSSSSFA